MIARRAIFRRYALVLATALAGGLLAYAALELAFATRAQVERTRELHVSEARAVAGRVSFFFEEIERSLVAIASLPWGAGLAEADRMTEYQGAMRRLPALREVVLADPGGAELLFASRSDASRVGSGAAADRDLVARARQDAVAFGPVRLGSAAGQAPSVQMAVRDSGTPARVTLATVDLQFVSDELARMPRRGGESAYMLDATGRLVSHADVSRPLQRSDEPHPVHAATLAIPHGSAWTRDADGRLVLAVWHRSESLPWTVVVESPWREALGPVMENLYRALAFVALAVLLAIVASRHLADRMARPVIMLKAGADAFGRGDLGHRIEIATGDELEDLAADFNRMAAQLREYTSGLEHLVEERTASLQEAMRARSLFLAAASHDLRQPLYAITILADTLALHPLPPDAADALAKQRAALSVLRGLFDNLLDLSRFESGEVPVNPRRIALRDALLPLAHEYEVVCRSKALAWRCDLPDLAVTTDPELLRRLAGNLLSNAARYTERGEVRLSARREGARVVVEVADTGAGIPREQQARVFDEFVQLDNPGRGRDRGVGLGLSIVRKVDALLDARLRLRSAPGEGTAVTFELPLAVGEPARQGAPIEAPAGSLEGLRVWIVEDDPLVRGALAAQFAAWGADPAFAASRVEVEALHQEDGRWPDAAIVDDMLGAERGLDTARWLATHMEARCILLVTGNLDAQAGEALLRSGFKSLHKPLSSTVIAQWLHDAAAAGAQEVRSA